MLKQTFQYTLVTTILVAAFLLQPLVPAIRARASAASSARSLDTVAAPAQPASACQIKLYLPLIIKSGGGPSATATTVSATAGPEFEIISPGAGWDISGTLFFAAQPTDPAAVTSVAFCAGSTELSTDSTPDDGFKIFLDTKSLPAGELELSALAAGPGGQTLETITVNVVSKPPSSGVIGSAGGVLASEIGSIITIPPGAVPDDANISVTEKTQEQVTADNGIDWDAMGVTFLGAQEIQSDADFSKPIRVSSAGFGNRVQPGQAVVNYRLMPDADGDGVDEIVVVNTASVAPNNDVVSDPVPEISVNAIRTSSKNDTEAVSFLQNKVIGSPGTVIKIDGAGFNPVSIRGNIARFESLVNGEVFEIPGYVSLGGNSEQTFSVLIPPLQPGNASLTIRNESTNSTSDTIIINVEASQPLNDTSANIINNFLTATINYYNGLSASLPSDLSIQLDNAVSRLSEVQHSIEEVSNSPTPEEQELLDDLAVVIENSGIVDRFPNQDALSSSDFCIDSDFYKEKAGELGALAGLTGPLTLSANPYVAAIPIALGGAAGFAFGVGWAAEELGLSCSSNPPECPPSQNNPPPSADTTPPRRITGMGSAPPSGGDACGNAANKGDSNSNVQANNSNQLAGYTAIKIFSGGSSIPFSGVTDAGGYFFIPLVPEGEPFTAIAIDTATGATQTFQGVGPPIGESTFMFFDFLNEDTTNATPIQFGEITSGSIDEAGQVDTYTFNGVAGDVVRVSLTDTAGDFFYPTFIVYRPDGTLLCQSSSDEDCTLDVSGAYTILVNDDLNDDTGDYNLYIQRINNPANASPIVFSQTITGTIAVAPELDAYTFDGTASAPIRLTMTVTAGDLDPQFRVYRPDGAFLCGQQSTSSAFIEQECTLEDTGSHIILAGNSYNRTTGEYHLTLEQP